MGKHKQTRKRNQKGGAWYNPLSWNQPTDPNVPRKSWGQWFSGTSNNAIQSADNLVGSAANFISTGTQNTFNRATNLFSSPTPSPTPTPTPVQPTQINDNQSFSTEFPSTNSTPPVSDYSNSSIGGKRRRGTKNRRMKGGYKDNLAYYAAPVQGLKVAAPTYWISAKTNPPLSGGSKRRVKKRLTRRKTYRNKK